MLTVHSIVNLPVTSNCYVLFDKAVGNDCIIVDPGSKDEIELFDYLRNEVLTPRLIILTHEHFDHCWGVKQLVDQFNIPIVCSQLCADAIKNEKRNCSVFYDNKEAFIINCETISTESIDHTLEYYGHEIVFFKTPGHTDASISFIVGDFLFTGDTLIKDERTVTKLPTGSITRLTESKELFKSMQGKEYMIFPGHGETLLLDDYCLDRMVV